MQKNNYIVESMYAKYTGRTNVQKKKLNESAQDMWVLVPTQNRYDDPIDVMKFAKKYGVFDSMSKAFDKAEELAPDRWDAFVPIRLSESLTEARNPEGKPLSELTPKERAKWKKEKEELRKKWGDDYKYDTSDSVDLGGAPIANWPPKRKSLSKLTPKERAKWEKDMEEIKKSDDYKQGRVDDRVDLGGAPLAEARNPENDEVNATIRKWADNGRLSKKDKEILDKNGLFTKPAYRWQSDGRTKAMSSATTHNQLTKRDIKNTHPDYDLAGKLKKKKLDSEDIEDNLSRQAWQRNMLSHDDYREQRKDDDYKVSGNQLKSLQPYAKEKHDIKRAKEERDYYSQKVKSAEDRLSNIRNSVKDKRDAKKKNESLSLKEGLNYDDLTEILYWCEKMCDKVGWWSSSDPAGLFLDRIFPYLNETQIQYAILDIKDDANNEE